MMYNADTITNEIKKNAEPTENKCDTEILFKTLTIAYKKSRNAVIAFIASLDESSIEIEDWHVLLQVAANLTGINICTLLEFVSNAEHKMFIPDKRWQEEAEMQEMIQAMAEEHDAEDQADLAAMLGTSEIPVCEDYPDYVIDELKYGGRPLEEDDPAWLQ